MEKKTDTKGHLLYNCLYKMPRLIKFTETENRLLVAMGQKKSYWDHVLIYTGFIPCVIEIFQNQILIVQHSEYTGENPTELYFLNDEF